MPTPREIAEAFSGHRFSVAYDHLAPDIRWVLVGADPIEGRENVIAACEATLAELGDSTTEFLRFLVVAEDDAAAVDAVGRYSARDGTTSTVASCDLYEFAQSLVSRITSYAVELT